MHHLHSREWMNVNLNIFQFQLNGQVFANAYTMGITSMINMYSDNFMV